ncbi:uncharacterized protein Tco025E_05429 [Trypanosoma conorhini]|uniref:Uncharacterized protein n=1 Tax=Trypanosoma conorhini TaxID=83891 RepID=A0A422PDA7_9TRYP|nr:uncharacterized protein Tco025E_05429 [Trypanosoma conorhini]RNF15695.1 hypothetical protein Tco025E_05429 [Trypanosoma conorhini]
MTPHSSDAAAKPESDAATRLDFYLPPPDHRAYRRGKIQRLRDQITAWRRQSRGGVAQTSARGGSADLPLWKAANATPTRRNVSRHEKVLLLSRVAPTPRSGRRTPSPAPHGDSHEKPLRLASYTNTLNSNTRATPLLGRVTEVPYFHDHTIFCLPRDRRAVAATAATTAAASVAAAETSGTLDDSDGAPRAEPGVCFCYGVTSNSEEMARHCEHASPAGKTTNSGATPPVKSTISSSSFKETASFSFSSPGSNGFRAASASASASAAAASVSAKRKALTVDSSFATKTQSVELAMAVHAERTRRSSTMQRPQSESLRQRVFERTMEIPIDWREFERLSSGCKASPPATLLEERASTPSLGHTRLTATSATGTEGRVPMRLYNICMKRRLANSEGSMEKASSFPRLGTRVTLSKSWV